MASANDEACDTNKLFTISQQRRMVVRDRPDSVGIALKMRRLGCPYLQLVAGVYRAFTRNKFSLLNEAGIWF